MQKVGINFDEISDNLDEALQTMKECGVTYGELRTVNGKNFVFWSDDEVAEFKIRIEAEGIDLVAAATPLFKWYIHEDDPEIVHDSFGLNSRLSDMEKRKVIERTFEVASTLSLLRLRIFSGLGKSDGAGKVFAQDPLLLFALELADKYAIDLYIENEPVCFVCTKADILDLLSAQPHPRLKLWLDIANLVELDEEIDEVFISQVTDRLGYVHVKDFNMVNGSKNYVPVGKGQIEYVKILSTIAELHDEDLIFTVETHAKADKVGASVESIKATKALVSSLK
jgi:sugar phosphate isomerase/epimerase